MEKKSKKGRPRVDTEPVNLRLSREMIQALDERRKLEDDLPSRPEMIRRALAQWLEGTQG
jgi:Arc/MetJ-type ribon-helix-helix transcriptional regulator